LQGLLLLVSQNLLVEEILVLQLLVFLLRLLLS